MGQQLSCTLLTVPCCTVRSYGVSGEARGSKVGLGHAAGRLDLVSGPVMCVCVFSQKKVFWAGTRKLWENNFLQAVGSRQEFWELSFLAAKSHLSFSKSTETSSWTRAWILGCVTSPGNQSILLRWLRGGRIQPWAGASLILSAPAEPARHQLPTKTLSLWSEPAGRT